MAREMYCQNCGTVARPTSLTRGSFAVELILWLIFIVPGLIYSLWRLSTRTKVCPTCRTPHMIPLDSPKAVAALHKSPFALKK